MSVLSDSREQEIERAWQQHDPDRAKIPINVWRQLRIYKRGIGADAGRIARGRTNYPKSLSWPIHQWVES